jgi:hypothetical protein
MTNTTLRLCTRIHDEPFLPLMLPETAQIITGVCSRCEQRVWIDALQPIPDNIPKETTVICTSCAVDDPDIGPTLHQNLITAELKKEMLGQTHVWEIDNDDG